jgi:hypothetical protein
LKVFLASAEGITFQPRQIIVNHNYRAMTKGLVTKKSAKKEPTKSLKEKRKEKKEKKSGK